MYIRPYRDLSIYINGAPSAAELASILNYYHDDGMMLFHQGNSLCTKVTFVRRADEGGNRVCVQVTHGEALYDGGYRRSVDEGGVHKAEGDSNRPEVKIQVSKETIEVSEEEEDEDSSSTTRKKNATRSSFTWATEKNGVTTTVIVKAQMNGVRLYVSTDYRAAREAFLTNVREWAATRSPAIGVFQGEISLG